MEWLATNWSWALIAGGVMALHIMTIVLTAPPPRTVRVKHPLKTGDRT